MPIRYSRFLLKVRQCLPGRFHPPLVGSRNAQPYCFNYLESLQPREGLLICSCVLHYELSLAVHGEYDRPARLLHLLHEIAGVSVNGWMPSIRSTMAIFRILNASSKMLPQAMPACNGTHGYRSYPTQPPRRAKVAV